MTTAVNTVVDRIAADVRQLVDPIHAAVRGRVITHAALLDSLRTAAAVLSSGSRGPERRPAPGSRPPGRGVDSLIQTTGTIDADIGMWHGRLYLPSPPEFVFDCPHRSCRELLMGGYRGPLCRVARRRRTDWQKTVLRQLTGAASSLSPEVGNWLAIDVHNWWHDAAVGSGWNPGDLLKLR